MLDKIKNALHKVGNFLKNIFGKIWSFIKKHKVISVIIAIILIIAIFLLVTSGNRKKKNMAGSTEYTVNRTTIEESITGSSIVQANDEYSVTPLVTGEILSANFEEGDIVEKDQVLYEIESSSVQNSLKSSQLNVEKAEISYRKALNSHTDDISEKNSESNRVAVQRSQQSYNDAMDMLDDLTVSAGFSGTVTNVYVSAGDDVATGTRIADITDNSIMKVRVPFNTYDAGNINSGDEAEVTLVDNGTVLWGTVESVSSGSETLNGNIRVSYVTVLVKNPGAVLAGDSVTAMINGYACNDVGSFEANESKAILSKVQGTISGVWVVKGDYIVIGSTIATIDSKSLDSQVKNSELSLREAQLKQQVAQLETSDADDYSAKLKSARLALDDALIQQDKLYEQLKDYTIKSPISGTVVRKNKKTGEKIEGGSAMASASSSSSSLTSSSSSSNVLAVIYDMTSMCCNLDVDELDVKKVKVGQSVSIHADAVAGKEYTGTVENVSINGTAGQNGVTTYPVKIRINDFDDSLLPGMNIDIEIVVNKADNVLSVPSGAVMRGNTVYVKGNKSDNNDKAPDGFKTVQVVTGVTDGTSVEIKSGLIEGDTVYVEQKQISSALDKMMSGEMATPHGGMGGGMSGNGGGMPGGGGSQGGMPSGGGR